MGEIGSPVAHELRNEVAEELISALGSENRGGRELSVEETRETGEESTKRAKEEGNGGPSGKRDHKVPPGEAFVRGKGTAVGSQEKVKQLLNRVRQQSLLGRRTVLRSPAQLWKREHCEPTALEMSVDNVPAAHGTEAQVEALEWQKGLVLPALPHVGDEGVAYTPADAACGSNPSRGWAETRRPMDARAHSPGAASRWRCHSIDTARARGRDGNCGY